MGRFRLIDRNTDYLLPPSVQDWLPESHLARYVVDVVEGLDLDVALGRVHHHLEGHGLLRDSS